MSLVTDKRNPAVKGAPLSVLPPAPQDDDGNVLATIPTPNRAARRVRVRPSTRQTTRDQKWAHTCLLMAAAHPTDLGEPVDTYIARVRALALAEWTREKRLARRRVRAARSHRPNLPRPMGRRFPVPTLGRPQT